MGQPGFCFPGPKLSAIMERKILCTSVKNPQEEISNLPSTSPSMTIPNESHLPRASNVWWYKDMEAAEYLP